MTTESGTVDQPLDLLIVGAGLSGIDLAHHVAQNFPHWSWEIHDTHDDLGGTWHTFTYPGIRSDSDMATFGFPFRPWPHKGTLGQGADIKEYIRDVARDCGALERLHTGSWIRDADWRTDLNLYAVTAVTAGGTEGTEGERTIYTRRVHYASGYYSHDKGFRPDFPGEEDFTGQIIHPQEWPEDLTVEGSRIVVIGSGATAITLVPALEKAGADVTMLQRSPSYVAPLPDVDVISGIWSRLLPAGPAHRAARLNHAVRDMAQYVLAQRAPWLFRNALRLMQRPYLSGDQIDEHFTPRYNPWDQRVCKAPNGDIFSALKRNAHVVTDTIDHVTADGVRLDSGRELAADVIVTATGLELEAFGGGTLSVDGRELALDEQVFYRGIMLAGLPNFSFTVGYVNASWMLRSDMVSRYMVKLWKTGEEYYSPELPPGRSDRPLLDFDAGYVRRGVHRFPTQGDASPWRYTQNYLTELPGLAFGDQRRDMAFGDRCLSRVGRSRPGPAIQTVEADGPFVATDLRALPPTETVTVGGRTVRLRRGGPGARQDGRDVIVMIHGIGRSLEDWDDQAVLVGENSRYIALDVPGFGFSDPAARVTLADTAELLWKVLDDLGETRVNLVGNSLGGALSMEMTAQRPDQVSSVSLADPVGFGDSTTPLIRLIAVPGLGRFNAATTRLRAVYQPVEHVVLRRPGAVTRHRLEVQRRIARHPHRSATFHSFVRHLGSPLGVAERWRRDLLARFSDATAGRIPVMLTWGSKDAILPYRDFRAGLEQIDVQDAVVFDDCGHMPQLEYPQEFAEHYQRFLFGVWATHGDADTGVRDRTGN
ncbi:MULTISPECIES: alpha/beta fold hydrolase [unclassified Corynebacterium]|uniref:alpha/beta fold hydrolase n=1 Tax=unclassified Corynebacterium TaxID=2624378 RepID=UPI002650DCEE|nr:alpha/beta fold hydrolase [Corynebacterium sp.]MDN6258305.1 alpha/beta fold hydrolase [Corynebacterium sp.]